MNKFSIIISFLAFQLIKTEKTEIIEDKDKEETKYFSQVIMIIMCIMMLNNYLEGIIKKLQIKYSWMKKYVQIAMLNVFLGIVLGGIIKISGKKMIVLTVKEAFQQIFTLILLPPILFEAALSTKLAPFFKNLGGIALFSILGTLISIFTMGILMWFSGLIYIARPLKLYHCFIFSTLFSATDPVSVLSTFKEIKVDSKLYSLVFGESILNDAVSLIFFRTMLELPETTFEFPKSAFNLYFSFSNLLLSSCVLGAIIGILGSYVLKKTYEKEKSENNYSHGISVMLILPWMSFLLADSFGLSGIVSIIFCGFTMGAYAIKNLDEYTAMSVHTIYGSVASNFEALAFIMIGFSLTAFQHNFSHIGFGLFFLTFIWVLVSRYCNICGISWIFSKCSKIRVDKKNQFVLWFSGLRGAMAFSIAIETSFKFPEDGVGDTLLSLTIFYIILTIFGFGGFLQTVVERLDLNQNGNVSELHNISQNTSNISISRFSNENIGDRIKIRLLRFNENFLKKYLILKKKKSRGSSSSRKVRRDSIEHQSPLEKGIKARTSYEEESDQSSEDADTFDPTDKIISNIELSTQQTEPDKIFDTEHDSSTRINIHRSTMSPSSEKQDETFSYIITEKSQMKKDGDFDHIEENPHSE